MPGREREADGMRPRDFKADEAWIVFEVLDGPVHTDDDGGKYKCIILMDAATQLAHGQEMYAADGEATATEVRRLLKVGYEETGKQPRTLLVAEESKIRKPALIAAEDAGIQVRQVKGELLEPFIEEYGRPL